MPYTYASINAFEAMQLQGEYALSMPAVNVRSA